MRCTLSTGQGEELEPARAKAELMGVKQIYIEDVREAGNCSGACTRLLFGST